jgi:hypothetical protein
MLSESNRLRVKSPFPGGTVTCATANQVIPASLEWVFDQPTDISTN